MGSGFIGFFCVVRPETAPVTQAFSLYKNIVNPKLSLQWFLSQTRLGFALPTQSISRLRQNHCVVSQCTVMGEDEKISLNPATSPTSRTTTESPSTSPTTKDSPKIINFFDRMVRHKPRDDLRGEDEKQAFQTFDTDRWVCFIQTLWLYWSPQLKGVVEETRKA